MCQSRYRSKHELFHLSLKLFLSQVVLWESARTMGRCHYFGALWTKIVVKSRCWSFIHATLSFFSYSLNYNCEGLVTLVKYIAKRKLGSIVTIHPFELTLLKCTLALPRRLFTKNYLTSFWFRHLYSDINDPPKLYSASFSIRCDDPVPVIFSCNQNSQFIW